MPEVHLPHLEEEEEGGAVEAPGHAGPGRTKSFLKIGLEVVLITTGVFLGLMGEQWRENSEHRELAHQALERFRAEFRANKAEVERVHGQHVQELKELYTYFKDHGAELAANERDASRPLPQPVPETVTDEAGVAFSAWDVALATESLAYIDPDLVATMSSAYRLQQVYQDAHRAIQQTQYSATSMVPLLRGHMTYFGDASLYEDLLLKRYDELLPRLDKAIGE